MEQLRSLWGEFREEADLVAKVTAAMRERGGGFNKGQIRRKLRQLQLEIPRKRRGTAPIELTETDWDLLLTTYHDLREEIIRAHLGPSSSDREPHLHEIFERYDDGPGRELTMAQMARALKSRGVPFVGTARAPRGQGYDSDSYSSFFSGEEDSYLDGEAVDRGGVAYDVLMRGDHAARERDGPEDSGSSFSSSFRSEEAPDPRAEAGEVSSPVEQAGVPKPEEAAAEEAPPSKRRRLSEQPEPASGQAGSAETAAAVTQEDVAPTQALDFSEAGLEDLEAPSEAGPPQGTQGVGGRRRAAVLSDSED